MSDTSTSPAPPSLETLKTALGERFGVLAESNTHQLTVIARNTDVAVGDLFLLPCKRGPERFYIFRTTQYANVMNRTLDMNDVARNKLTMPGSYLSQDLAEENLIELKGIGAVMFAKRLQFDIAWSIKDGILSLKTLGGTPAKKIAMISKIYGEQADQDILELTAKRLLVRHSEETNFDWRRVATPAK